MYLNYWKYLEKVLRTFEGSMRNGMLNGKIVKKPVKYENIDFPGFRKSETKMPFFHVF